MKRKIIATIFGTTLIAAPAVMYAQDYSFTDGRSGGTNVPSETSGAVPSTSPLTDARTESSDATTRVIAPDQSIDSRAVVTSDGTVVRSTYPADEGAPVISQYANESSRVEHIAQYDSTSRAAAAEPRRSWWQSFKDKFSASDNSFVTQYSLTDGTNGGAGVPSATSGAVPSTSPNQDLAELGEHEGHVINRGPFSSRPPHDRYSALDTERME